MMKSRPSGRRIGVICLLALLVALPAVVMGPLRQSDDSSANAATAEVAGPQIRRLYLAYFEREPDPVGWPFWLEHRAQGRSLTWVSERFSESDEFKARYGNVSDAEFIRLVYRNVLGRTPDPIGLQGWSAAIADGASRGSVMVGFSESQEFIAKTPPATTGPASPRPTTPPTTPPATTPPPTTPRPTTPPPTTPPPTTSPPTVPPVTLPGSPVGVGNDSWLFVGDSITVMSVNSSIEDLVRQSVPSRRPRVTNVAVGGSTASTWGDSQASGGDLRSALAASDARFVVLALGTNDNHNYFSQPYERLVQQVIAAGKVPVLPHVPWTNNWPAGHAERINPQIDAILARYPQAIAGADLTSVTANRPDLFKGVNDVHPNDTGQQVIRQAWANMMARVS
jgi:lysophospholipase L1-like esterase